MAAHVLHVVIDDEECGENFPNQDNVGALPSPAMLAGSSGGRSRDGSSHLTKRRSDSLDSSDSNLLPSPSKRRRADFHSPSHSRQRSESVDCLALPSSPKKATSASPVVFASPATRKKAKALKVLGVSAEEYKRTQALREVGVDTRLVMSHEDLTQLANASPPKPVRKNSDSQTTSNFTPNQTLQKRRFYKSRRSADLTSRAEAFKKLVRRTLKSKGFNFDGVTSHPLAHISLLEVLQSKVGMKYFQLFVKLEHAEENLLFWQRVEQFRKKPSLRAARAIMAEFITPGGTAEINISYSVRSPVERMMERAGQQKLKNEELATVFDGAQQAIYRLMEQDTLPRFRMSEMWQECIKKDQGLDK